MKKETINKLCCPFDKGDLKLTEITKDTSNKILEGFLVCTNCERLYPIVKGIPIMSPDEYRDYKLELPLVERWQKHLKGRTIENFRISAPLEVEG